MIESGVDSFFGGLIQAAVGSAGGFGAMPLKRRGWATNAESSVTARCAVIAAAVWGLAQVLDLLSQVIWPLAIAGIVACVRY